MPTLEETKVIIKKADYIVKTAFDGNILDKLENETDFMTDLCKTKFLPEWFYLKIAVIDYTLYQILGNTEEKFLLSSGIIEQLSDYLKETELTLDIGVAESKLSIYGQIFAQAETNGISPYGPLCMALFNNSNLTKDKDYTASDYATFQFKFFVPDIMGTQKFIASIFKSSKNTGCTTACFIIVLLFINYYLF